MLMSALAVILMSVLTRPTAPSREVPALVGAPRTVSTPAGTVNIAPVKVYSTGALIEVNAALTATPDELLARPDLVLTPSSSHDEYALTLRTRASGADGLTRPLDTAGGNHPRHWNLAFWLPRAAWSDAAPHLVWPIAHLDSPLELSNVELTKAALVVRLRGQ